MYPIETNLSWIYITMFSYFYSWYRWKARLREDLARFIRSFEWKGNRQRDISSVFSTQWVIGRCFSTRITNCIKFSRLNPNYSRSPFWGIQQKWLSLHWFRWIHHRSGHCVQVGSVARIQNENLLQMLVKYHLSPGKTPLFFRGTLDDKIHFIFNMYDVSHDKSVSKQELATLLNQGTEHSNGLIINNTHFHHFPSPSCSFASRDDMRALWMYSGW